MTTRLHDPKGIITKVADAALATAFTLVKLKTTDPEKVQQSGSGEAVFGILLQTAGASGDRVEVCTDGYCLLKVDGSGTAIAAGDPIMAGASGVGVKLAGAAGTLRPVIGYACAPSTASGDLIPIQVRQNTAQAA